MLKHSARNFRGTVQISDSSRRNFILSRHLNLQELHKTQVRLEASLVNFNLSTFGFITDLSTGKENIPNTIAGMYPYVINGHIKSILDGKKIETSFSARLCQ